MVKRHRGSVSPEPCWWTEDRFAVARSVEGLVLPGYPSFRVKAEDDCFGFETLAW